MPDCIFCRIVSGAAPASIVYEDDLVSAIMDISPVNAGHLLVLPKMHTPSLSDLDDATGAHVFMTATRMAQALRRCGVRCEGVNLLLADGEAAGQEVSHVHMHVLPRFAGDGFHISTGSPIQTPREKLDGLATLIRRAAESLHDSPRDHPSSMVD